MSIRSLMLMLAVGTTGLTTTAADPVATNTGGGGFQCTNGVGCVGTIALLPITVNVKDVRALNANELEILSEDLNSLSILDGGILNHNTILEDVELDVLTDFLNKFDIDVSYNALTRFPTLSKSFATWRRNNADSRSHAHARRRNR